MKYLIVIAVVLVAVWLWRNNRRAELRDKPAPRRPVTGPHQLPTEIVACAVCAVHLPRPDAVPGKRGLYCSDAHRRQAED
ncbi:PP0621 family protein [Polaromonas sp. SM01]|uniref:PP0621 family protein n=1 Tax=Polaromonas sp. SM01 TaxID=3085630 RepID=UPI00298226D3|nr:PP0621 family protein [Polaromonas sp. SM01]MDW5445063.1 PP0621 family protein [Polaromonas sp. SM01]